MKLKRILSWLTVLVMLVSLLPAGALTASASGGEYRTILVGLIDYVQGGLGEDFLVRYWGGADGVDDASLENLNDSVQKSVGGQYWNGDPQTFYLYAAKIPADATGFKVWYPSTSRWFGNDGDAELNDRVFIFEYGGSDLAFYGSPIETVATPEEWEALAADVEHGLDYAGRTVTMAAGIGTSVPIGREDRPFRGTFDGGGNQLSIEIDDSGMRGAAPFRCISDGAVIRNLNVTGSIIGDWHSGGLVGFCMGGTPDEPNIIEDCRVEVNVGGCSYLGGIVGHGTSSVLVMQRCVYSGVLSDGDSCCGGLQGWGDSNDLTVTDCLYCGTYTGSNTFDPIAIGCGNHAFTNAYYTGEPVNVSSEGTPVSQSLPEDSLAVPGNILGTQIWILGSTEVSGFDDWYVCDGTQHNIEPEVRYNGILLTEGTDYTWTIDGQSITCVTDKGFYTLTVTGMGDYSGSVSRSIAVIPASLSGTGDQSDPWLIEDGADWIRFALNVADGTSYRGEYVELTADIPVTMKVGVVTGSSQVHPFSGDFNGGGHTLIVDITDTGNQGTAPFCYINGAAIHDLNVTGSVHGEYHAAGLVGFTRSDEDENQNRYLNRIENCVVDTDVYSGDYLGGIVGHGLDAELVIENCLYTGLLVGGNSAKGALLGWDDSGAKAIINCCYVMRDNQDANGLHLLSGLSGSVTLTDCYCTTDDCDDGVRVYQTEPPACVFGWVTVAGHNFALPCEVRNVAAVYNCAGGPVTPAPEVCFGATLLTEDADYELDVIRIGGKSSAADEVGSYELQINGINDFNGTFAIPFQVGCVSWTLEPDGSNRYTILHISGTGPMEDLTDYPYDGSGRYDVPELSMGDITTVIIDVGITAIGDYAFDGFPNIERVTIPAGLKTVGEYAFTDSGSGFTELKLPASLNTVEVGAFAGLHYVTDVWCARDQQSWDDFVNSPAVETLDNQVLTGWNNSWQPVTYHYTTLSNISFAAVSHGSGYAEVNGQQYAYQAGDGELVNVVPQPDVGYLPDDLQISYLDTDGLTSRNDLVFPLMAFTMPYGSDVTVTLGFRPIVYFVAFDPNGGSGNMPDQSFTYDLSQNLDPNVFTKPGFDFDGWNTLPDGTGIGFQDQDPALNLADTEGAVATLFAQWLGWNYDVKFDPNGATNGSMPNQPFTYGTAQALTPNAFDYPGYHFMGWSTDPSGSGGIEYTDGETVDILPASNGATVILYALWEPNEYTVHFDPNGGTGTMTDQPFVYDVPDALYPNAFSRLGYDFDAWNEQPDGSGPSYTDTQTVANLTTAEGDTVTLFAQWTPHQYTIVFDDNAPAGSTTGSMSPQVFTYDVSQNLTPNAFQRPGYLFQGWNDDPAGNGNPFADGAPIFNLTDQNGVTFTLYAQWKPIDYIVRFDPNAPVNGYGGTMTDQPFIYDVSQNLDANLYGRPGYTFLGWNTAADGSGTPYQDGALVSNLTTVNGDIVILYAQWQAHTYTVHFDANGGTGNMTDQGFTFDQPQNLSPLGFSRTGYDFQGWCEDPSGNGIIYTDRELVANLTYQDGVTIWLYAIWKPVHWTVIFHANGSGQADYSQVIDYDSMDALLPCQFAWSGHHFIDWNTDPNGSGQGYANMSVPGNLFTVNGQTLDLYAQWGPSTYTVIFWANAPTGSYTGSMQNQYFVYGVSQNLLPLGYSRPGYEFIEWHYLDIGGTPHTYSDMQSVQNLSDIDNDLVDLYAQWSPYTYTIVYRINGGDDGAMLNQTMTYDTPRALTANAFSKTGYTFAGWNTAADGSGTSYTNQQVVNILPPSNGATIRLYAQWIPNSYSVAYDPNGGTGSMPNQSFTYDSSGALLPNAFTRTGYTFIGWNTRADGTGTSYGDGAIVANLTSVNNRTVTLYAQWRAHTYTVQFERNGAILGRMQPQTFTYDVAQNLDLNVFIHSTYVFYHWNTMPDDSGTSYSNGESVLNLTDVDGGVVTLYAQWGPIFAYINYEANGGNLMFSNTYCASGVTVTFETIPDPGNVLYSLSAVYYDVEGMPVDLALEQVGEEDNLWSFVMPAGDVLVTAVFGPRVPDGFYLIGPDWTLDAIDVNNAFTPDPATPDQYLLQTTLAEGQQIKVVKVAGGAITAWYPDGYENEYTVDADHAGEKTVLFREFFYDDWTEFGGYIWIDANAVEPPAPVLDTSLRLYTSLNLGIEITENISVRKTQMERFDHWYIQVDKLDADGNILETLRYGEGQANPVELGSPMHSAVFAGITAKEMGVSFVASVHCFDADGNERYNVDDATSFREYLIDELLNTGNADVTRTLCADMLNYAAAAQRFFDYDTGHMVNENLSAEAQAAKDHFETGDEPSAGRVNTVSANMSCSVSVMNRIVVSIRGRRLNAGSAEVKFEVKDSQGNVRAVLDTTPRGSSFTADFDGMEAEDMREPFTFTALVDGVATGEPVTWSVEGYVREARTVDLSTLDPESREFKEKELALFNALLNYVDAVSANDDFFANS